MGHGGFGGSQRVRTVSQAHSGERCSTARNEWIASGFKKKGPPQLAILHCSWHVFLFFCSVHFYSGGLQKTQFFATIPRVEMNDNAPLDFPRPWRSDAEVLEVAHFTCDEDLSLVEAFAEGIQRERRSGEPGGRSRASEPAESSSSTWVFGGFELV